MSSKRPGVRDLNARKIIALGEGVALNMERDESSRAGDLREALEHFALAVAWCERRDARSGGADR